MRVIIVGGGKLAYYLIKTLQIHRHHITLIELDKGVCERLANDFDDINVYNGDGTVIRTLEQAGCRGADFYIAVTGKDENNLIGCQIAKLRLNVKTTVARVNNPKNSEMFNLLGVDHVYCGTQILADIIEQEVDLVGMRRAFSIENTGKSIMEFHLSPKSAAKNKMLKDYTFPANSTLVLLTRQDGQIEMPRGDLVMKSGDLMLLVCDDKDLDTVWRAMVR